MFGQAVKGLCPAALASGLALTSGLAGPASADEAEFQKRFSAAWAGSGRVVRDADGVPKPTRVTCTMDVTANAGAIAMDGTCRAYLLFTRPFDAKVRYDESSGRYVGVYHGAKSGPAQLSGRRQGDTIDFTVTWTKPVNGDRTAQLSISNDGQSIAVRLTDEAQGQRVTTTDLMFAQK